MSKSLEQKINEINQSGPEINVIFKNFLTTRYGLAEREEILDLVYLKREYDNNVAGAELYSAAVLLIATTKGVSLIEEGLSKIEISYGGYRIRHILYSKINCLEFDTCLLSGVFKMILGSDPEHDVVIAFNTAEYYYDFEAITNLIRKMIISHD